MPSSPAELLSEHPETDVEAVLAWHDGDARAAIETLLKDCRHLRQQLVEDAALAHATDEWHLRCVRAIARIGRHEFVGRRARQMLAR